MSSHGHGHTNPLITPLSSVAAERSLDTPHHHYHPINSKVMENISLITQSNETAAGHPGHVAYFDATPPSAIQQNLSSSPPRVEGTMMMVPRLPTEMHQQGVIPYDNYLPVSSSSSSSSNGA